MRAPPPSTSFLLPETDQPHPQENALDPNQPLLEPETHYPSSESSSIHSEEEENDTEASKKRNQLFDRFKDDLITIQPNPSMLKERFKKDNREYRKFLEGREFEVPSGKPFTSDTDEDSLTSRSSLGSTSKSSGERLTISRTKTRGEEKTKEGGEEEKEVIRGGSIFSLTVPSAPHRPPHGKFLII